MSAGNVPDRKRKVIDPGRTIFRLDEAQHRHCGPPSSCLGAYFTPPSSPSIGTWPGLFALPCPSTLVSTPVYIASVDSGLDSLL